MLRCAELGLCRVALRKESVDRNCNIGFQHRYIAVALRKESVDRNQHCHPCISALCVSLSARRAWIEIGPVCAYPAPAWSLSARRAWIEMSEIEAAGYYGIVALRKESVDRNRLSPGMSGFAAWSLSARRAWIEIMVSSYVMGHRLVALRKESVDRNGCTRSAAPSMGSRSPQGERG